MRKPWSISTTVRNPERLKDFLRVLSLLDGQKFDRPNQIKYQVMLIKERLYRPLRIPIEYKEIFDDPTKPIPYQVAEEVFYYQDYQDPPMRGRQSVNPLNKLGFSIARESAGEIRITELGKLFLNEEVDIGYVFLKSLIKLQFPNPWSDEFKKSEGFNIRPFVAFLHLMKKAGGELTKDEFCLFVPTLINFEDIDKYAEKIEEYRKLKGKQKENFKIKFLEEFYELENIPAKKINNLVDYGDNAMRYFRLTKYFMIEKCALGDWKIKFERLRMQEINQLISKYNGSAIEFKSEEEYLSYLSDISQPVLPWEEDIEKLRKIAIDLMDDIKKDFEKNFNIIPKYMVEGYEKIVKTNISSLNQQDLEKFIDSERKYRLSLIKIKEKMLLRKNIANLKEIVKSLKDKKILKDIEPHEFENIIFKIISIINDEIEIKPNCVFDDEGNPISFAPGNKPDIEGFYDDFNVIYEVTLDTSRMQAFRESVPVMRHLREFEKKYSDKPSYCMFIAPKIHEDTINYFWFSIKNGFQGEKQKIIPIDFEMFFNFINLFINIMEKTGEFSHKQMKKLFDLILDKAEKEESSIEWFKEIYAIIKYWGME